MNLKWEDYSGYGWGWYNHRTPCKREVEVKKRSDDSNSSWKKEPYFEGGGRGHEPNNVDSF